MKKKLIPIRNNLLIVGAPQVLPGDADIIASVVESGMWVNGPKSRELEKDFKKYIGCKFAIPVSSGTDALRLSLEALNIGPGDEVITTPFTYPATSHVIVNLNAKPVFVDVQNDTYNIDPKKIEQSITPKTKAIIPVDIAGHPCDWTEIMKIAKKHNLYVIDDAAHSLEAFHNNKKIGIIADLTCFSFDVTKNCPGGVGGIITTNNKKWADKARTLSHYGFKQNSFSEGYDTLNFGYKNDITEFSAALALINLQRINSNLEIRNKYWNILNTELSDIPEFTLPVEKNTILHARHLYMILLDLESLNCSRKEFMEALATVGIQSRIRFTPVHLHQAYRQKFGFQSGDYPITEGIGNRVISLPFSPALSRKDIDDIINGLKTVVDFFNGTKNYKNSDFLNNSPSLI